MNRGPLSRRSHLQTPSCRNLFLFLLGSFSHNVHMRTCIHHAARSAGAEYGRQSLDLLTMTNFRPRTWLQFSGNQMDAVLSHPQPSLQGRNCSRTLECTIVGVLHGRHPAPMTVWAAWTKGSSGSGVDAFDISTVIGCSVKDPF